MKRHFCNHCGEEIEKGGGLTEGRLTLCISIDLIIQGYGGKDVPAKVHGWQSDELDICWLQKNNPYQVDREGVVHPVTRKDMDLCKPCLIKLIQTENPESTYEPE